MVRTNVALRAQIHLRGSRACWIVFKRLCVVRLCFVCVRPCVCLCRFKRALHCTHTFYTLKIVSIGASVAAPEAAAAADDDDDDDECAVDRAEPVAAAAEDVEEEEVDDEEEPAEEAEADDEEDDEGFSITLRYST